MKVKHFCGKLISVPDGRGAVAGSTESRITHKAKIAEQEVKAK